MWHRGRGGKHAVQNQETCVCIQPPRVLTASVCNSTSEGLSFLGCNIGILIADPLFLSLSVSLMIPEQLWMFEAL